VRENDSRLKRKSKGGSGDWGSGEPLELGDFWNGEWGVEIENGEWRSRMGKRKSRVLGFSALLRCFFLFLKAYWAWLNFKLQNF